MIIVIADDITGAAELAGIGVRYGLRVKLSVDVDDLNTDLLVVYSNTRSMEKQQAAFEMKALARKAGRLKPLFIYKKTDSVLRGHVSAELKAQMEVLGLEKALLVPANPALGRTIEDGIYYINGEPLHKTNFSADPEFPAHTSTVTEILKDEEMNVSLVKPGEALNPGLNVGETKTADDMRQWAKHLNEDVLIAGGGFFFDVLLSERYLRKEIPSNASINYPVLFVIGTAFQKDEEKLTGIGRDILHMPEALFSDDHIDEQKVKEWSDEIIAVIKKHNKAFIAIGNRKKGNAGLLREKMAQVVKLVVQKAKPSEVIIEGGATAYSIVTELNWQLFTPVQELAYGVVKMKVEDEGEMYLTIKPGSYPWPSTWDFK